ncbi:MAG: glutathione S-transferase [Rubrivivax sp.]|nr:glutathione S-transferase [Rubrivivax sp.]
MTPTQHTLYGSQGSGSAAIEMALRAAGLPYTVVRASTWEDDSAQAELRRVNPLGQIPTLVLPDGSVMTESAAILIHLGLSQPGKAHPGLLPADTTARAQALRGLVFITANCYSAISVGDYPERWTTASTQPAQAKVRAAARVQLHRSWDIFADSFAASPWLSGNEPGALDFLAVVVSRWSGARAHLAASRPAFHALLQRLQAHPAVAPVWQAHWPG